MEANVTALLPVKLNCQPVSDVALLAPFTPFQTTVPPPIASRGPVGMSSKTAIRVIAAIVPARTVTLLSALVLVTLFIASPLSSAFRPISASSILAEAFLTLRTWLPKMWDTYRRVPIDCGGIPIYYEHYSPFAQV